MRPLKAYVRNGHFVVEEPTSLPEGTEVELQLLTDAWQNMDPDERAELEESIEQGFRDFEKGDHMEARAFMAQLRTRSS